MKRFVVSLALALCGCANIVQHAERRYSAFCGTAEASVEFARVFSSCETYRHGYLSDAGVGHTVAVLLSPVLFCDLPLEVVADLLTCPYDAMSERK